MELGLSTREWVLLVAAGSVLLFALPWGYVLARRRRRQWLLRHGREARARIVTVTSSGLTFGSGSENVKGVRLELDVLSDDGGSYRVKTHAQLHLIELSRVQPGTTVRVRVHPDRPDQIAIAEWT